MRSPLKNSATLYFNAIEIRTTRDEPENSVREKNEGTMSQIENYNDYPIKTNNCG